MELLLLLGFFNCKYAVKFALDTCKILFYHPAFFSFFFEKVRELIGEIKYAFAFPSVNYYVNMEYRLFAC